MIKDIKNCSNCKYESTQQDIKETGEYCKSPTALANIIDSNGICSGWKKVKNYISPQKVSTITSYHIIQ